MIYGCAITGYKPIDTSPKYRTQQLKNYEIGQSLKTYVGEPIIEVGTINVISGKAIMFRSLVDIDQPGFLRAGFPPMKKDQLYQATNYSSNDNSFLVLLGTKCVLWDCRYYHAKVNNDGNIISRYVVNPLGLNQNPVYFSDYNEGDRLFEKIETTKKSLCKDLFKMQLIYNGRDNTGLNISYREFKDDLARPAFYQSLTYNLHESDTIRYKSFKLQILNANNEEIVYRVIED